MLAPSAVALVLVCGFWVAPHKASEAHLGKLILEAATFYDSNPTHKRVSEAKAISDLLTVARTKQTSLLRRVVRRVENRFRDYSGTHNLQKALYALATLAFTRGDDDPEFEDMAGVKLIDRRIHLRMPTPFHYHKGDPEPVIGYEEYVFDNEFGSNLRKRRDLTPFLGQVMTPAQYAADHRVHGEEDFIPPHRIPPSETAHLLRLLEDAWVSYAGNKGDNRRLVADLIAVALTPDSVAIRDASALFVKRHGREDRAAAVLDPLEELLWDQSTINPRVHGSFRSFVVNRGTLVLSSHWVYMGIDNMEWPGRLEVNECYWKRRDLSRFKKQAALFR